MNLPSHIPGVLNLLVKNNHEYCTYVIFFFFFYREVNGKPKHDSGPTRKERPQKRGGGGRFEPYGNVNKRYRVFVSNIPYDVKWQALKDLMKEKGRVSGDG